MDCGGDQVPAKELIAQELEAGTREFVERATVPENSPIVSIEPHTEPTGRNQGPDDSTGAALQINSNMVVI